MGNTAKWPLYVDKEGCTSQFSRFCIQPLDRDASNALADSLRRALVESLPGAAVSGLRFRLVREQGADPQRESALLLHLMKWLQELRIMSPAQFPLTGAIRKCGPFWLTESELIFSAPVRITSAATAPIELRNGETLELDFMLRWRKGEISADKVREEGLPKGWIPLSSSHSPVRSMRFNTVTIEVGPHLGREQLIAEITTDGSISPEDAFRRAGSHVVLPSGP